MSALPNDRLEAAHREMMAAVEALGGDCIVTMRLDGLLNCVSNVQGKRCVDLLEDHLFVAKQSVVSDGDG